MIKLNLQQLQKILLQDLQCEYIRKSNSNIAQLAGTEICGVSIDTRTLQAGNLFVALPSDSGANGVDGHDFLADAASKGARATLISNNKVITENLNNDIPCFVVKDTVNALGKLAIYWRSKFELPIIAVTGSNGKTSIKNMIGAILLQVCNKNSEQILIAHGNFNNHLGVPLNLFKLTAQQRYAVLEMGMSHFGEIAYLTNMVRPNVAVISNAYACHLDGVGDLDGVARAKAEIFQGLQSIEQQPAYAILNADDRYFNYWKKKAANHKIISFALEKPSDVFGKDLRSNLGESQFVLHSPKGNIEINLPLPGKHNVMNALAAAAACLAVNIELPLIKAGLETITATDKRLQVLVTRQGARLINDCYNANPASLRAAINVLMNCSGKKILVIGDMKELGKDEIELHANMGSYAKRAGIDGLLAIGKLTKHTVATFGRNAHHFANKNALIDYLQTFLAKGNNILIKGSRSMQMEEIVQEITEK